MNIVETNIEIKVEEEFLAGINIVKEIEGDNDVVPKEESPSACMNMKKELKKLLEIKK